VKVLQHAMQTVIIVAARLRADLLIALEACCVTWSNGATSTTGSEIRPTPSGPRPFSTGVTSKRALSTPSGSFRVIRAVYAASSQHDALAAEGAISRFWTVMTGVSE